MGNSVLRLVAGTQLSKIGAVTSVLLIAMVALVGFGIPVSGDSTDIGSSSDVSPVSSSSSPDAELPVVESFDGPDLILPVFNQRGLDELLGELAAEMRTTDSVLIVTGNNDRALDLEWLRYSADRIRSEIPGVNVYAMTAGLEHVRMIRDADINGISGIVYDYENHFPNEPEFTYEFEATLSNVREFHTSLEGSGLKSVLLPTGLPLTRSYVQKWEWDYSEFNKIADSVIIQTQTYCLDSLEEFEAAVSKANAQHVNSGLEGVSWTSQVTVDPGSRNGVSPERAIECTALAVEDGHDEVMVWWSPWHTDDVLEYMALLGR